jgi:anti-sigma B factor antagonist
MEILFEQTDDNIQRIHLTGRMDIQGTGEIEDRLAAHALTEDHARIILDLSQVSYLASIGLGCLVRTAQGVDRRKGKLVFLCPQPIVAKVLAESGVSQRVRVFETLSSAIDFLERLPQGEE